MNLPVEFTLKYGLYLLLLTPGALARDYVIYTIAGGMLPATPASGVQIPGGGVQGLAVDSSVNIYFNSLNCVFKIDAAGVSIVDWTWLPRQSAQISKELTVEIRGKNRRGPSFEWRLVLEKG